eukprot:8683349-Lingulodinium_polyedra.AAC.1
MGNIGRSLPSTSKWYTFEPSLTAEAAGFLVHNILPTVWSTAFQHDGRADDDGDPCESKEWHTEQTRRVQKGLTFVQDSAKSRSV